MLLKIKPIFPSSGSVGNQVFGSLLSVCYFTSAVQLSTLAALWRPAIGADVSSARNFVRSTLKQIKSSEVGTTSFASSRNTCYPRPSYFIRGFSSQCDSRPTNTRSDLSRNRKPNSKMSVEQKQQTTNKYGPTDSDLTVHAAHITEVHNVPMRVLIRPIPSVLDEAKVQSLMDTIQDPSTADSVPPMDILWVKGREGGDYYYSFGGCHRYEAYKRLQREMVPCKIFKSTVEDIRVYLGGSMPDLL